LQNYGRLTTPLAVTTAASQPPPPRLRRVSPERAGPGPRARYAL